MEKRRVRGLAAEMGVWDTYRFNLPTGSRKRERATKVFRVLKALFEAYATRADDELEALEVTARTALGTIAEAHKGARGGRMLVLAKRRPGWTHPLGDLIRQKGDPRGKSSDLELWVNDLEALAHDSQGPFDPKEHDGARFAEHFALSASGLEWAREMIPNADRVLAQGSPKERLPPDHPAVLASAQVAKAFAKWNSGRKGEAGDFDALVIASFRAAGASKDDAGNLFKWRDMREKRRARRSDASE